jgi:hypothetical protein
MIGGLGIPLPLPPQVASVPLPYNQANYLAANQFDLPAGASVLVPPGTWMIYLGSYSWLQFQDPVSGQWLQLASGTRTAFVTISSDGGNYRVWNPKGFPVSATVTGAGSGYVQASTTVTATGASLWHAIVGGALGTFTVGNDAKGNAGGKNFSKAPTILIAPPPSLLAGLPSTATAQGGVQATATAALSAGSISAVTIDVAGAGYQAPPLVQVIPDPFDVNIGLITVPTVTVALTGAGTITAVLMDYYGNAAGGAPTLTVAGAGSSGTATANIVATGATDTIVMQLVGSSL